MLINPQNFDPVESIMEDTGGNEVDVVIERSGFTGALIRVL